MHLMAVVHTPNVCHWKKYQSKWTLRFGFMFAGYKEGHEKVFFLVHIVSQQPLKSLSGFAHGLARCINHPVTVLGSTRQFTFFSSQQSQQWTACFPVSNIVSISKMWQCRVNITVFCCNSSQDDMAIGDHRFLLLIFNTGFGQFFCFVIVT